jgi:hypothetical protein
MKDSIDFINYCRKNNILKLNVDCFLDSDKSIKHTLKFYYSEFKKEQMKDSIVESVIEQFKQRSEVGKVKYGITLDRTDLSALQWMVHFREELQDGLLYLERVIKDTQKENIIDIMKSDEELGLYANTFSGTTSSITNGTTGTISTTTTHYDTK